MKITRSILLIAFLMLFYRAFGQPAERLIRIQITPNHTDWLYKPGEKIKFSITVLKTTYQFLTQKFGTRFQKI